MVDVVMVILIFFMLGTSFAASEGMLPTQLPADVGPGGAAAVSIVPVVRIGLEQAGAGGVRIRVMGQPLVEQSYGALQAYMRGKRDAGADPKGRVVVAAGPDVRYKHVISAFNACVRAGFENVQFAVTAAADTRGGGAGG
jgi:biopolymer transport protein ExbD